MVSADTIVQASATLIVGIIFLVILRQALGLQITRKFLFWIFLPTYFWVCASITVIFQDEIWMQQLNCTRLGCISPALVGDILFILGLVALLIIIVSVSGEFRPKQIRSDTKQK
jgi:hypothetical protein